MATEETPQAGPSATSMSLVQNDPDSSSLVSLDIRLMHNATHPQVYPVMSPSKSSNPTSASSTSTAPLQDNVTTTAQSAQSTQPLPSTLALYGIKVRDFAYESTLPPVATVPRVPRQVQPGPRLLKRTRTDCDESDDESLVKRSHLQPRSNVSNVGGETTKKMKLLERKLTEPADDVDDPPATRIRGFGNLSLHDLVTDFPSHSGAPAGPSQMTDSQLSDFSPASKSQPPLQFDSQESELYIDTPLVTPNGTLQWQPKDAVPLGSHLQDPGPGPVIVSFSESDLLPKVALEDDVLGPSTSAPCVLSPHSHASTAPSPSYLLPRSSPTIDPDAPSRSSTPEPAFTRYFFRTRPVAPPYTPPHPGGRSRSKPRHNLVTQSAHSMAKTPNNKGSPRARTIRKSNTSGEGSIVLTT
jgi:hypothetical protein